MIHLFQGFCYFFPSSLALLFLRIPEETECFSAALHPFLPTGCQYTLIDNGYTDQYDLISAWLNSPKFCKLSSSVCVLQGSGICLWLLKQAPGDLLLCCRAAQVARGAPFLHVSLLTWAEM